MAISLSGMASGLDTESIISQLMAIEQNKVTAVQKRQVAVNQHKTDLSAIKAKLDAVKTAANDLQSATLWKPTQTTTSSDPTKIDVSVLGGAGIGGHSIQVDRLASSAQHGFDYAKGANAGKLTFAYSNDAASTVTIDIAANASAADVAAAVNANEKAPVYAAVVKDGATEKLVFSSRKTGANADFTVDTSQLGAGTTLTEDTSYQRTGPTLNAAIKVNGGAETNPESNILENIIPGVRVTLKGVSTSPVTVSTTQPAIDNDAIAKKITALVDAYNSVVTATRAEITEKRVPTATTTSDLQKGQLFGDSGMTSMLRQLKQTMTQAVSGLGLTGLADLGIGVPKAGASAEDARSGKLTVDQDKLKAAIASDYTKVRELFAGKGATKGMSGLITEYIGTQTGTNGIITGRMKTDDETVKGFNEQITKLNARMEKESARLKAQFAAMESALNASQTQQAWLTSQIGSLPSL
ncbi:flagellar filament capping protein FliD [Solirubrobacter sp. CPCC 204708]|uniref:Flagellar hook-associated protein 2 n=1 Tax=Solirubrobacter deserti TaxID=2282478 RepID=A0ABT4RMH9_9ACTN|nr:flagellar filament capping protein FliD [Solirubrobacter deserti]MBE2316943.1 flagellar filament capping protein FliD [Solirubrobacter deserti]MDA0139774.1 flagellar filament capping protein FliD [Solirubrobacter deserti]